MKKIILYFGLLLLVISCHQQGENTTSTRTNNQMNIIKGYKKISYISNTYPDSLIIYAANLERLAKKEPKFYKAMAAHVKGVYYLNSSSYKLAKKQFEKTIQYIDAPEYDTIKAKSYIGLGNYYKNTGDYPAAFRCLFKSLRIYEKFKNKYGISATRGCIAQIYLQKNDVESAKKNLKISLNVLGNSKYNHFYLISSHTLANIYGMSGDFEKALAIDKECLDISNLLKTPRNTVMFLDNKANCLMYSNQLDSAAYYFKECLKIDITIGEKKQIADTYTNLGHLALFRNDFKSAEENLNQSIAILKSINQKPNISEAYSILVKLYEKQGNFKKALATQKEKENIYQQVISEKKEAALAEFTILYETQKKEQQLAENKVLLLEKQAEVYYKNQVVLAVSLLAFCIAFVGFMFYRQQKNKNHQQEQEHQLKTAIAQIEKQNELQGQRLQISRDLHDNIGSHLTFIISSIDAIMFAFEIKNAKLEQKLNTISNFARSTIVELRDTIWAMNYHEISIEELQSRILNFIEKAKDSKETILFNIAIDDRMRSIKLSSLVGMNCYRLIQEAINNAIKHSEASEICLSISLVENTIKIEVEDNGKGFDLAIIEKGVGLITMQKRADEIRSQLTIKSKLGQGTTISMSIII
jgi:signal transduction histidine kinase